MSQALAKLEASINAQQKKLAQLKAHKQKIEAREKAKLQGKARQQDTRRKILAGAMLLETMAKDLDVQKQMLSRLSAFLTRADDRSLFGLPEQAKPPETPRSERSNRMGLRAVADPSDAHDPTQSRAFSHEPVAQQGHLRPAVSEPLTPEQPPEPPPPIGPDVPAPDIGDPPPGPGFPEPVREPGIPPSPMARV